jgi:hypothetical protein
MARLLPLSINASRRNGLAQRALPVARVFGKLTAYLTRGTFGMANWALRIVGFLWLGAFCAQPAAADVRILSSPGGPVIPYIKVFEAVRDSGERVWIDGPCFSACTLVLSVVPADRICITRRAVLGFHAARSVDNRGRVRAEPRASRIVLETYPLPVQQWIRRRGGLTSRVLLLRGRDLAEMYPRCR